MGPSCENWGAWDGWANWHGQTWDGGLVSREQRQDEQSPWHDHPSAGYTYENTFHDGEQLHTNSTSPPVSYHEAATWNMVRATNVSPEGPALDQSSQSAPTSSLRHDWPTSGTMLCHAQSPDEAGSDGLMHAVNGQAGHALNTSAHHHSEDTVSDFIVNSNSHEWGSEPPYPDISAELVPRRQSPRFVGDEYTARWVRGHGTDRAGWCGFCSSWHKLKDSAYWYHMHYSHGISCATGKPFEAPKAHRTAQGAVGFELHCGCCSQWVYVGRLDRWQTPYYRHAYKCQMKNRFGVDRYRVSRPTSTSPRNMPARLQRSV